MKNFILLIFAFFAYTLGCNAQNVWQQDTVISTPGKSKQQIINCAKQWATSSFAQFSPTIFNDENSITINLSLPFEIKNMSYAAGSGKLIGQIKIYAKDERFKIELSNFDHVSSNPRYTEWWSMGLILENTPEQWANGAKWKQKREVYKRILEALNTLKISTFNSAAEYIPACTPIEEEDW